MKSPNRSAGRRRDEILARQNAGESLASIARDFAISRQRVHEIIHAPNPDSAAVTYECTQCNGQWSTRAVYLPERCAACGSYDW